MLRKLLFIICFCFSVAAFSQEATIGSVTSAPNPFTTKTSISFTLSGSEKVTFSVKNILGRTVLKKTIKAYKGKNTISFYKNKLASGVYIYSIKNKKNSISKRFVIK